MTVSIQLSDEQTALLAAKARARGLSAEQYVRQMLEHDLEQDAESRPVWEVLAESMNHVPSEDVAALPKDGASQIDHYIYGHPKTNQ